MSEFGTDFPIWRPAQLSCNERDRNRQPPEWQSFSINFRAERRSPGDFSPVPIPTRPLDGHARTRNHHGAPAPDRGRYVAPSPGTAACRVRVSVLCWALHLTDPTVPAEGLCHKTPAQSSAQSRITGRTSSPPESGRDEYPHHRESHGVGHEADGFVRRSRCFGISFQHEPSTRRVSGVPARWPAKRVHRKHFTLQEGLNA